MAQIDYTPVNTPFTLKAPRLNARNFAARTVKVLGRMALMPGYAVISAICAMGRAFETALVDPYQPKQRRDQRKY